MRGLMNPLMLFMDFSWCILCVNWISHLWSKSASASKWDMFVYNAWIYQDHSFIYENQCSYSHIILKIKNQSKFIEHGWFLWYFPRFTGNIKVFIKIWTNEHHFSNNTSLNKNNDVSYMHVNNWYILVPLHYIYK